LLLYSKKKNCNNYFQNINLPSFCNLNVYSYIFFFINLFKNQINYKYLKYILRQYIFVFLYLVKHNFFKSFSNKVNFNFFQNNNSNFLLKKDIYTKIDKNTIIFIIFYKDLFYYYFNNDIYKTKKNLYFKSYNKFNLRFKFFLFKKISLLDNYNYIYTNSFFFKNNINLNLFNNTILITNNKFINLNYFFIDNYNEKFNLFFKNSNYDFNLFKYYTLNYNVKYNNLFGSYLKSFFFFEIFLKKFFE
jgi:hypothetical protein